MVKADGGAKRSKPNAPKPIEDNPALMRLTGREALETVSEKIER